MGTQGISRRNFLKTAAGAVGVGLLASCGGSPAAPQAADSTAAPAAAAPAGNIEAEGVLWGLKYDPHVEAYKRLADLFQKQIFRAFLANRAKRSVIARYEGKLLPALTIIHSLPVASHIDE